MSDWDDKLRYLAGNRNHHVIHVYRLAIVLSGLSLILSIGTAAHFIRRAKKCSFPAGQPYFFLENVIFFSERKYFSASKHNFSDRKCYFI